MQRDEINSCFYTFRDLKVAKCQKAVCGDIRHHEKAKCWKGQAAKRGQFGAKKANIHWFKKLKRAGKGQAWCKKANIYWLKEWSHIGRHLLQRLFRSGQSRNDSKVSKKRNIKLIKSYKWEILYHFWTSAAHGDCDSPFSHCKCLMFFPFWKRCISQSFQ